MTRINMEADASQESAGFPIAQPGDYIVQVVDVRDGMTKGNPAKGTPSRSCVDLQFTITDEDGRKHGTAWEKVTFIPKGQAGHGIWLHVNHALGLPYDGSVDFGTEEYRDRMCRARIGVEKYVNKDGEERTKNTIEEFYTEDTPKGAAVLEKPAATRPAASAPRTQTAKQRALI